MTKHELLQILYQNQWVTPSMIAESLNLSPTGVFSRLEVLRKSGFVTRKQFQGQSGNLLYHFTITQKGLKKLAFFNSEGCRKPECSLC